MIYAILIFAGLTLAVQMHSLEDASKKLTDMGANLKAKALLIPLLICGGFCALVGVVTAFEDGAARSIHSMLIVTGSSLFFSSLFLLFRHCKSEGNRAQRNLTKG